VKTRQKVLLAILAAAIVCAAAIRGTICPWSAHRAKKAHAAFVRGHPDCIGKLASQRAVARAEQILAGLKTTRYSHWASVKEGEGLYAVDCSGLACLIVGSAAPGSLEAVPVELTLSSFPKCLTV